MRKIDLVCYLGWACVCVACGSATDDIGQDDAALTSHCGGNLANAPQCPDGFDCVPDPDSTLPFGDVGGICVEMSDSSGDIDDAEPTSTPNDVDPPSAPDHCGGNLANAPQCPDGFDCVPDPDSTLPFGDVGGICVASN